MTQKDRGWVGKIKQRTDCSRHERNRNKHQAIKEKLKLLSHHKKYKHERDHYEDGTQEKRRENQAIKENKGNVKEMTVKDEKEQMVSKTLKWLQSSCKKGESACEIRKQPASHKWWRSLLQSQAIAILAQYLAQQRNCVAVFSSFDVISAVIMDKSDITSKTAVSSSDLKYQSGRPAPIWN